MVIHSAFYGFTMDSARHRIVAFQQCQSLYVLIHLIDLIRER